MRHALVAVVIVAVVAGTAGAAPDVFAIDDDHPLATEQAVTEYEATDVVRANLTRLNASLTIAQTSEAAGIEGTYTDVNKHYVCVDYREEIARTLRIYYPAEYFEPRVAEADSITSDHVADLEPTGNRSATALSVSFTGPARACFPIGAEAGTYFGIKAWASDTIANLTGWSPPSLGGGETQWRYVPEGAFANTTYTIEHNASELTMQYAHVRQGEQQWISVPGCDDPADQQVCHTGRSDNATTLVSTQADPPKVRWKPGGDATADAGSAWNDLAAGVDRAVDWFGDLLGSGGGDE